MAPPSTMTPLAIGLLRAREDANLTQDQAAAFIGVSAATYRRWERGIGEPGASQLVTTAVALNTTPEQLLAGTQGDTLPAGIVHRLLELERAVDELRQLVLELHGRRSS